MPPHWSAFASWRPPAGTSRPSTPKCATARRGRLTVYEALRNGNYFPWDFQPLRAASDRYMRNHMDLNVLEDSQRFPRGE